jgi:type VI secretion system VasD/TssJ family lipoprotein
MPFVVPFHRFHRFVLSLIGVGLALSLVGCGGPSPLSVRAVAPVNLNEQGESLPVRLRIYELKDRSQFLAASFNDLWLDDRKALGADRLADPRQLVVQPGKPDGNALRYDLIEVAAGTRFIGVMALYPRGGEQDDERRVAIALDDLSDHVIELSGYQLMLKDR